MRVAEVRRRMMPYSHTTLNPKRIDEVALDDFRQALSGPRTNQGFTGVLSFNHDDYDRIEGFYWVACVDDHVVQVYIYDNSVAVE